VSASSAALQAPSERPGHRRPPRAVIALHDGRVGQRGDTRGADRDRERSAASRPRCGRSADTAVARRGRLAGAAGRAEVTAAGRRPPRARPAPSRTGASPRSPRAPGTRVVVAGRQPSPTASSIDSAAPAAQHPRRGRPLHSVAGHRRHRHGRSAPDGRARPIERSTDDCRAHQRGGAVAPAASRPRVNSRR
jgi:hypothetical protein